MVFRHDNIQAHFPPILATKIKELLWSTSARTVKKNIPSDNNGAAGEVSTSQAARAKNDSTSLALKRHAPLLLSVVADSLGCEVEDILDFELQLADTQPAAVIGACDEFISSGRLDNQGTCYTATRALIDSLNYDQPPPYSPDCSSSLDEDTSIRMITMFDHEEVGSLSAQGAESPFFSETLERAAAALGVSDYFAFKARSFQISSDMAHAVRIVPLK